MILWHVQGARQAGLKPEYVAKLESTRTYEAPPHIVKLRKSRPPLADLREISLEELTRHDGRDKLNAKGLTVPVNANKEAAVWLSVLGYVVQPFHAPWFPSHKGRDITTRMLHQINHKAMDENDDG